MRYNARLLFSVCIAVLPGKPGRPQVIEVIGTSVHLQWTAPKWKGATYITEYTIEFSKSDIAVSVDANAEPLKSYTIRNQLQPQTKYRFAVAAVNSKGQGPWSAESVVINTLSRMLFFIKMS